ncbi:MAG: hypothetical protein KJ674_03185 [Nanoarchaeota archaeon]|nr:hypothetical protein [Nanoarchaeota archaeon]
MSIYSKIKKEHLFIFLILLATIILFNYFNFDYTGLVTKRTCYNEGYSCCDLNEGEGFNYFSLDESCSSGMGCYDSCKYNEVKNLVTGDVGFIDAVVDWFKGFFEKDVVGEDISNCCRCEDGEETYPYTVNPSDVGDEDECQVYCEEEKGYNFYQFVENAQARSPPYSSCQSLGILIPNECPEGYNALFSYADGHASLNVDEYENKVCSQKVQRDDTSTVKLIALSTPSNAHVEQVESGYANIYTNFVGVKAATGLTGTVNVIYGDSTDCNGKEHLFLISGDTNAHIDGYDVFDLKACVSVGEAPPIGDCDDLEGNICNSGQTCQGGSFVNSGDGGTGTNALCCTGTCVTPTCDNNGIKESGEECDGLDLNNKNCVNYISSSSYIGGILACTDQCTFDISGCDVGECTLETYEEDCGDNKYCYDGVCKLIECNDGIDNDGDSKCDYLGCEGMAWDDDCLSENDFYEGTDITQLTGTQCDDEIDNDGDGLVDYDGFRNDLGQLEISKDPDCNNNPEGMEDIVAPTINDFYPDIGEEISETKPEIIVNYSDETNLKSVNLLLDDADITSSSVITDIEGGKKIKYIPAQDLTETIHFVNFTVNDTSNNQDKKSWSFYIEDVTYPNINHDLIEKIYNGSDLQINVSVFDSGGIKSVKLYSNLCESNNTLLMTGAVYDMQSLTSFCNMNEIDQNEGWKIYNYTVLKNKISLLYESNGKIYYYIEVEDSAGNKAYYGEIISDTNEGYTTDYNSVSPIEVMVVIPEDCNSENNNLDGDSAIAGLDSDCGFGNKVKLDSINIGGLVDNVKNISYKDSTVDIACNYKVVNGNDILSDYKEAGYNCIKAKVGNIECSKDSRTGSTARFEDCSVGNVIQENILAECYVDNECMREGNNKQKIINVEEYSYCNNYEGDDEGISLADLSISGNYDPGEIIEINPTSPMVSYYLDDGKKLKVSAAIVDIRNDNKLMEQGSNEVSTEWGGDYSFSLSLDVPNPVSDGIYKVFVKAYNANEASCSQEGYSIGINDIDCDDEDGDGYCSDDCDDANENINPSALEICDDLVDNDCDGLIDDLDSDCLLNETCTDGSTLQCSTGLQGVCGEGEKTCFDGTYSACVQKNQATIEQCSDLLDNDCDGKIDCSDSDCSSLQICKSSSGDDDNDGMDDAWELEHFNNLNQGPSADYDGDGVSNFQEFLDNTDPSNKSDYLKKTSYMWLFYVIGIIVLIGIIFFVLKYFKPKKKEFTQEFHKMPSNAGLKNYVRDSLRRGFSKDQIKRALKAKGWKDSDIDGAFR